MTEELEEKELSLLGLQRLRIALLETQKDMIGTRDCIGEPWFKPYWERYVSVRVVCTVCMCCHLLSGKCVNCACNTKEYHGSLVGRRNSNHHC